MVTIFALAAALLYGSADFLGGVATRRAQALSILPASTLAGLAIVLVAALAAGESPSRGGLAWGLAAGAVGGIGLIIFYAGLAKGPMIIVAPTSALSATVLPVAVSLAGGERASATVYAGALICLAAIVLVSAAGSPSGDGALRSSAAGDGESGGGEPGDGEAVSKKRAASLIDRLARRGFHVRAIGYGLAAGATFGLFFIFLRNAGQSGAFWPIVASRLAGFLIVVIAAAVTRTRPVIASGGPRLLLATFGSGILDASANVSYVLATRAGLFGLAVVLTSLYPGVTVMLARFVLGERLRVVQVAGLLLAAAGIVLVTV
ncbi:MAG TPA: DMT family transporter [Streptosporangiaceae bacterium]